ncbi:MAG: HTTM domain-containing protein [Chitinophagaceae bacterium]
MKKISSSISRFFCKPVPFQTLGAFRIAIGVFAFVQLLILLPDWMWLYGPQGLIPWEISDALATRHTPGLSLVASMLATIGLTSNQTIYVVTAIYFLSLIGLILGYKSQLMGGIAWISHLLLNSTGHFTAYGVETFAHIGLFYCMVLPVGVSFSCDNRLKPATVAPYLVTLSVRIIQLHLCIMYFASGLEKAMGTQWWNGNAIWIAMQQDQFHRVNIDWMASVPLVPKILCLGTLLLETVYPLGILWSKTRKFWLVGILMMHLGIALFLGLQLFGGLMFLFNLSIFGEYCFPGVFSKWKKAANEQSSGTRGLPLGYA